MCGLLYYNLLITKNSQTFQQLSTPTKGNQHCEITTFIVDKLNAKYMFILCVNVNKKLKPYLNIPK